MPIKGLAVHVVETKPKMGDKVYSNHLLRHSCREENQVKSRTVANLSPLPDHLIELLRLGLKGEAVGPVIGQWDLVEARPHGHVATVVGTAPALGFDRTFGTRKSRKKDLATAPVAGRVLHTGSKLSLSAPLSREPVLLGQAPGVGGMRTNCVRPWTGLWHGRGRSRMPSPGGTWQAAAWGGLGIRGTATATACRSPMACFAIQRVARSGGGIRGQRQRLPDRGKPGGESEGAVRAGPCGARGARKSSLPLLNLCHGQPVLASCIGRGNLASGQIQHDCSLPLGRPSLDLSFWGFGLGHRASPGKQPDPYRVDY